MIKCLLYLGEYRWVPKSVVYKGMFSLYLTPWEKVYLFYSTKQEMLPMWILFFIFLHLPVDGWERKSFFFCIHCIVLIIPFPIRLFWLLMVIVMVMVTVMTGVVTYVKGIERGRCSTLVNKQIKDYRIRSFWSGGELAGWLWWWCKWTAAAPQLRDLWSGDSDYPS